MSRGSSDYTRFNTQTSILTTEYELPIPFESGFSRLDNGGRVVWYENFTNGLYRYNPIATGGGITPYLAMIQNRCYGLNPSCVLDPFDNNGQSLIQAQPRMPLSGKIGIELCYYIAEEHGDIDIILAPVIGYGLHAGYFLRQEASTEEFQIYTGGAYQTVYTPPTPSYFYDKFIAIKLVIDFDSASYDTLLLGGERITLGQAGRPNFVGGDGGSAFHQFECSGAGGALFQEAYLSYIVISADEQ